MSDDKYDPAGPTRRIDDWKPIGQSGVTRGADNPNTGATKPLDKAAPAPGDGATLYAPDPAKKAKEKDDPDGAAVRKDPVSGELNFMHDPVVGWLVIVKGPGRGLGLRLGVGMNTIGRGEANRLRIDFGDPQISREKHCVVTFEPRRRVFYIQNEGGQNLTYVGDVVVLQPKELLAGETISIGGTDLRFIPLCGADFNWEVPAV